MKKYNFYAGPSILPEYTIKETSKAILDFAGTGLSVMEVSHRGKEFVAVMDEAISLVKELLNVPEGYSVLFLQGGASSQFYMVPFNLMKKKAAYLDTGTWAHKAIKEAKIFGEVEVVGSSEEQNYNYLPRTFEVPSDVDYFHYTSNNTIFGTEYIEDFDLDVPVVADMSSDIFSRPIDITKYDLIYAGAQKNLAPAGVTLVIVKDEILGKVDRQIPTMIDYRTHIKKESMFNTPPCVPIFAALQTLKWLKAKGGVEAIEKENIAKAELLYNELDRNSLVEPVVKEKEDRSRMNISFVMTEQYKKYEPEFLVFATERNIVGIKGHRSVGGFRASTYNAMDIEGVSALVDALKDFEKKVLETEKVNACNA